MRGGTLIGKDPHHNLRFRMRQIAVDRHRHNYILYISRSEALMGRCQTSRNIFTGAFVKGKCSMSHGLYLGHSTTRISEVKSPMSQLIYWLPSLRQQNSNLPTSSREQCSEPKYLFTILFAILRPLCITIGLGNPLLHQLKVLAEPISCLFSDLPC